MKKCYSGFRIERCALATPEYTELAALDSFDGKTFLVNFDFDKFPDFLDIRCQYNLQKYGD